MSDLPCDITEEILLRLPARSLLRFKLVCRRWRSLFSNPNFVKNHANHVVLDQENRGHKVITDWNTSKEGDSWRHYIISQSIDYESLSSTDFELNNRIRKVPTIVSSCNGLLLIIIKFLYSKCEYPLIWNPLTKKFNILPKSNFASSYSTCFVGFGYVASTDDYKVVKLSRDKSNGNPRYSEVQVEIYSLKTNSWKIISGVPTSIWTSKGTYVHGSIYWIIHEKPKSAIIAFDLISEKFNIIEPPWEDIDVRCNYLVDLVQIRGCLGGYRCGDEIVTWIRNEDENKKGYWTKLHTIPMEYPATILGLLVINNKEVLLHVNQEGSRKLVMYDLTRRIFRDIVHGNIRNPVHMVETLVSPSGSDCDHNVTLKKNRYSKRKRCA